MKKILLIMLWFVLPVESYPYSNVSRCPAFNYYFDFDTILTYKD